MDFQNKKCVLLIDGTLPLGVAANTAAILGITLGRRMPEAVGEDVADQDGNCHLGIIGFPVPVLRSSAGQMKEIREKLYRPEFQDLTVADFSQLAQGCRTYGEFIGKMARTQAGELSYLGLAICGNRKKINQLTGSMPLLR